MKKILLPALLLFNFLASAQTSVYHPFADSGAVWVMQWLNSCTSGPPCILTCTADYQYRIDGDTIISGNTYKKVIKEGYSHSNCNCVMNVPSCSGSTYSSGFYMGIRDDVPNRRSYINDGVNPEELFFDFNLNVGDTIQNRYCTQHIIYIDSMQVGSDYRKAYMVSGNARIIEGIGYWDGGYYSGPFEGCGPCVCNDEWLLQCYKLNGVTLLGDTSCALVTSTKEIRDHNLAVTLYPNPATNQLTVRSSEFGEIDKVEIYNILSKKIFSQHPMVGSRQQFTIDISFFNAGIYFVKVKEKNKEAVIKLIKE